MNVILIFSLNEDKQTHIKRGGVEQSTATVWGGGGGRVEASFVIDLIFVTISTIRPISSAQTIKKCSMRISNDTAV